MGSLKLNLEQFLSLYRNCLEEMKCFLPVIGLLAVVFPTFSVSTSTCKMLPMSNKGKWSCAIDDVPVEVKPENMRVMTISQLVCFRKGYRIWVYCKETENYLNWVQLTKVQDPNNPGRWINKIMNTNDIKKQIYEICRDPIMPKLNV